VGELFDVPVTLSVQFAVGKAFEVPAAISERVTEVRIPVTGPVRSVDISKDDGTMAEIIRN
jgi:hypothetical protein